MTKIAINGLGRIGRLILRRYLDGSYRDLQIVAVNDPMPKDNLLYLLKYDSVYGPLDHSVAFNDGELCIGEQLFSHYSETDAHHLPWDRHEIDFVIDCSGQFCSNNRAMRHIDAGADKVILSAPSSDADITLVMGINQHLFESKRHLIISNASCTTNCLAPVLKVLSDEFGILRAFATTVHAYTASQQLVDTAARKYHRGRGAAVNIIPTSSGADACTLQVLPELQGRLSVSALRVPVACGSLIDLSAELADGAIREDINLAFEQAAAGEMSNIIQYSTEQLVSSDIIGNPHSAIIHSIATSVLQDNMLKLYAWYDNEYAYACRCLDLVETVSCQPLKAPPEVA